MDWVVSLWRATYLRYVAASVVALGIDLAVFLPLTAWGLPAAAAAAAGYCSGILAHWLISTRAVFVGGVAEGTDRYRQQAMFAASALLGLAITVLVVGACARAGIDSRVGKLVAIGVSFQVTYLVRARVVFGRLRLRTRLAKLR